MTDPLAELRIVFLVPRRDGKVDRDRAWAYVRQRTRDIFPDWPIYEGHHDTGLFNRSAAVNRAAGMADWEQSKAWDVAIIIDSDCIIDETRLRQGVRIAVETGRMVVPFDTRYNLDRRMSEKIIGGYRGSWSPGIEKTYTEMVSSFVVVTRALWNAVNGFDEGFVGWGFEDNAFAAACETFSGPLVKMPGECWHLWHETAKKESVGTPTFEANRARANRYLEVRGDQEATRKLRSASPPAYEHRPTGIPRILHRVVPEVTRPEAEEWWAELEAMHPSWTMMTHRDPLDPADWPETRHKWGDVSSGAQFADLIRLEALRRWGGVYVDQDYQPFRSFEPLLPLSAFAAWEDHNSVPNAVMGAVPGHPAIIACLELILTRIPGGTWLAGPGVLTDVLPGRPDVLLLPPGSFYPVHYRDPDRVAKMADPKVKRSNPWSFGIHRYWHSWKDVDG